ncbi:hypothetical protein [Streptomyces sp. V3I7]|uniref:hypothetical protein n=1 Tax=Streptomyces sp. V3I7 TaxID=3042278 RepID=UPI002788E2C9|nr:hypothetical protein [Streptomyces sp. V3I7]
MLATSLCGAPLARIAGPRRMIRLGLATLTAAIVWLLATIKPAIDDAQFAWAMAQRGAGSPVSGEAACCAATDHRRQKGLVRPPQAA